MGKTASGFSYEHNHPPPLSPPPQRLRPSANDNSLGRLAHQLLPLLASSAHPIITFMAAVSGEGTSTIALAFAESLVAQHDQKVLLISANTKLNAGKVAGLVDMCAAGQNTGEIFSDNTNRVTHATWVANPVHRSLAGKYVRDAGFWQKLRAQFDTIIIDAPSL